MLKPEVRFNDDHTVAYVGATGDVTDELFDIAELSNDSLFVVEYDVLAECDFEDDIYDPEIVKFFQQVLEKAVGCNVIHFVKI